MTKRRLAYTFIALALLGLAALPAHKLWMVGGAASKQPGGWRAVYRDAYQFDFLLPYATRVLYALDISSDPAQAIVGKDGWLFLGDAHRAAVSHRRTGAAAGDVALARAVDAASLSWQTWMAGQGVNAYRVLVCADKESVYPEFLPGWAQPAPRGPTDAMFEVADRERYIDTRPALRNAKSNAGYQYFKTDTHWNSLGAWAAYQALSASLAKTEPSLRSLSASDVRLSASSVRAGGDLARFLRLNAVLHESVKSLELIAPPPFEQVDFNTGAALAFDGNRELEAPKRAQLLTSAAALNKKRVLWLRDSFGRAMAPFMTATFSEVLQIHYLNVNAALLAELVRRFKPDYVVLSVVERDAMDPHFSSMLPPAAGKKAE